VSGEHVGALVEQRLGAPEVPEAPDGIEVDVQPEPGVDRELPSPGALTARSANKKVDAMYGIRSNASLNQAIRQRPWLNDQLLGEIVKSCGSGFWGGVPSGHQLRLITSSASP
jgi:hypothetical protein